MDPQDQDQTTPDPRSAGAAGPAGGAAGPTMPDTPGPPFEPADADLVDAALVAGDDDVAGDEAVEGEGSDVSDVRAPTGLGPGRNRLVVLAVNIGAALVVTQALFVLLTIIEGLSLRRTGQGSFPGDNLHRIGIAFSTSVNIASALALIAAVALVSIPAALPTGASRLRGLRMASLVGVEVVAAVIAVGTILGIRASLHGTTVQNQSVAPYQRWELAAYAAGTLGTAVVAFFAALAATPSRDATPPSPE